MKNISTIVPQFSVVITSYNYGEFLPFALDSALCQTYRNFEIIVIDDGSTDNTEEVIKPYLADSRIHYIRQKNAGQPKAKNRGVAECRGELIAFLDADDIWFPEKLEKQWLLFNDSNVGVVYSRRQWIDSQGEMLPGNERVLRRGNVLDHIFIDNFICFSSSVVKRDVLNEVGCFDENLPMGIDYDLWIRLAARCKFDYVDEPLVKYRTGHANLSKNVWKRYDCAQRIMNKSLASDEISKKLSPFTKSRAWADTWSNMACIYFFQGNYRKSLFYFIKAVKINPLSVSIWKRIIKCIIRRK